MPEGWRGLTPKTRSIELRARAKSEAHLKKAKSLPVRSSTPSPAGVPRIALSAPVLLSRNRGAGLSFLNEEQIIDHAFEMHEAGDIKSSIVTSGYILTDREMDRVCRAAWAIQKQSELEVSGSMGLLTPSMVKKLVENGGTTYHHNLDRINNPVFIAG
jgi:hypothetical protein